MGQFIRHEACQRCSSSDGCAVYEDDSKHCFVCGFTPTFKDFLEKNGYGYEYNEELDSMGIEFNSEVHDKIKAETGLDSKGYRGVRTDISKYFGVRYQYSGKADGSVVKTPLSLHKEL